MKSPTISVLPPGDMGATVAASARAGGSRVLWASEERSPQTRERAAAAGLEDAKTLASLGATSDGILSVCPPPSALALARAGGDQAWRGEWARSQPELGARSERAAGETARKAWRFTGEMTEIAATFDDAGLPDGFFRAAGAGYESLACF